MLVVMEFKFNIFYFKTIFFILIHIYKNENVQAVRLKINNLRSTDIEGNGLNDLEIFKYQQSNLKIKNHRATNQRGITRPEDVISDQLKKGKFRSAHLPSTKGENGKKTILKKNVSSNVTFSTNPTVVSTLQTSSKKNKLVTTNLKGISKNKKKSKKKLKVKSSSTKKVELKTNTKKNKSNLLTIKSTTSKRRLVKQKNVVEITTSKNNQQEDDEDLELKNVIKTKAINKALDLFSNSLVKSLSDQLWDQFVMKSKKVQNSVPQRDEEDSKVLQEKPVPNILRNEENLKTPRKQENVNAMRQTEESVERFEIIL